MKILFKNGKKIFWKSGDLHTSDGVIKEKDLKKKTSRVKTHKGKEFSLLPSSFFDEMEKIKRLPQAMMEKDISSVIIYTGISRNSKVLEAGVGSGKLTAYIARAINPGKLYGYDVKKQYLKIAKENLSLLKIKNVVLKNKDVYKGIKEKNLDLVFLDLSDPYKVVRHARKSLKNGAYLASFSPHITQSKKLVGEAERHGFIHIKTFENLEREWIIDKKRARPKSDQQFTGFLTMLRNVK